MTVIPYKGEENYAFVSYSHKDTDLVNPILMKMNSIGIRFWFDKGIESEDWRERLDEQIVKSRVIIVFLSENFLSSKHCKREINLADDNQKEFIILRLDNSLPKGAIAYTLSGIQYNDLFSDSPFIIEELQNDRL